MSPLNPRRAQNTQQTQNVTRTRKSILKWCKIDCFIIVYCYAFFPPRRVYCNCSNIWLKFYVSFSVLWRGLLLVMYALPTVEHLPTNQWSTLSNNGHAQECAVVPKCLVIYTFQRTKQQTYCSTKPCYRIGKHSSSALRNRLNFSFNRQEK